MKIKVVQGVNCKQNTCQNMNKTTYVKSGLKTLKQNVIINLLCGKAIIKSFVICLETAYFTYCMNFELRTYTCNFIGVCSIFNNNNITDKQTINLRKKYYQLHFGLFSIGSFKFKT